MTMLTKRYTLKELMRGRSYGYKAHKNGVEEELLNIEVPNNLDNGSPVVVEVEGNDTHNDGHRSLSSYNSNKRHKNKDDDRYIIGDTVTRQGKVIKYNIYDDKLWNIIMEIFYHRIIVSGGTQCLLNLKTISRQITRTTNISSIAAVEQSVIRLVSERFGVRTKHGGKRPRASISELKGTLKFWGHVGGSTANSRKRVAIVYQVIDGRKIMKYIEENTDVDCENIIKKNKQARKNTKSDAR